jgi:uncharacterized protein (DUF924 family)
MTDYRPEDVLAFWFGEGEEYGKRQKRWFEKDAAFDEEIARRFGVLYERLRSSDEWLDPARPCLARIIVLDQFPRNMFRGNPRAFATDPLALQAARHAVDAGFDRELLPAERLFVYLPFEHSERLEDQERACMLCEPLGAFPETDDVPNYACKHRDIVKRFGRFPHRNAILGRDSTPEELEFLKQPGSSF